MAIDMFWYGEERGFGENLSSPKGREPWEPRNYKDWLEQDRLIHLLENNQQLDVTNLDELAIAVFDAWVRMPPPIRRQVWREREIAAQLYELSLSMNWRRIPGFLSTGVGQREVEKRHQIVGIINVKSLSELREIYFDDYYEKFRIPRFLKVPSLIKPFNLNDFEVVVLLEESPIFESFTNYTAQDNSSVFYQSFPQVQSGDVIHCEDIDGISTTPGTLSAIVVSKETSDSGTSQKYKILTVAHVLNEYHPLVFTHEITPQIKVGELYVHNSKLIKSLASRLDAAIADLDDDCSVNPNVKWADIIPAPPIMPWTNMPVQMYAGQSKYQQGYINQSNCLPAGGTLNGIVPFFTVDISSIPGDSGTLLVSGHGEHHGIPESMANNMLPEYLNSSVCAMLGMLVAGSSGSTTFKQVCFRPVTEIFHWLKVVPYVRKIF